MGSSSQTWQGFDLTKSADPTQSIFTNFLPMNLSGITKDAKNNFVTAICSVGSTSNLTFTQNNVATEFMAKNMYIIGSSKGSKYPLHLIKGLEGGYTGELIIKLKDTNNTKILYICYPLSLASAAASGSEQVDNVLNIDPNTSTMIVDFNLAINSKGGPANYVVYSNSSDNSTVVLFTRPIYITSINLLSLQNNISIFDMVPKNGYSVLSLTDDEGDWMECDFVPIGSDTINTYSLPITSGLVKDLSTFDSYKTIIMFIIFFVVCGFSYLLVPAIYLAIVVRVFGHGFLDQSEKKTRVLYLDYTLTVLFAGIGIILVLVGLFAHVKNAGDLILTGLILCIIYAIGYVIIQSKKLAGKFIDGVKYEYGE
jgi:hypothetical protein